MSENKRMRMSGGPGRMAVARLGVAAALMAMATVLSAQAAFRSLNSTPVPEGEAVSWGVQEGTAPPTWAPQDPADTLYRAAREALNRGDYRRAAELFAQIDEDSPDSEYAPDAPYWEAFARYRIGGEDQLRLALAAIQRQRDEYPRAATRRDAEALEVRIRSVLARRGDAESAAEIATVARAAATSAAVRASVDAATAVVANVPAMVEAAMAGVDPALQAAMTSVEPALMAARASMAAVGPEMEQARVALEQMRIARGMQEPQEDCTDEDEIRLAALSALMEMDDDRALPILREVMANQDACPALRQHALMIIAESNSDQAEELLLDVARTDPDPEVRAQAVFWLSEVDSEQAVDVLGELLRTSDDRTLQERALFALAEHDSPRAVEMLHDYATREDVPMELRANAIFWIGERGEPQDLDLLRGLFAQATSSEIKQRILFAIAESGDDAGAAWLMDVALDTSESPEIRKQALFWASEAGAPIDALVQLYDRATDRQMKEQLIFVYAERDEPAAVDKLIDIVRNEEDAELRKHAVFWLTESDDPRVVEVLIDILNGNR